MLKSDQSVVNELSKSCLQVAVTEEVEVVVIEGASEAEEVHQEGAVEIEDEEEEAAEEVNQG